MSAYAFVQYADITSVVRALRQMDGEHIGANKIKVNERQIFPSIFPHPLFYLQNQPKSNDLPK